MQRDYREEVAGLQRRAEDAEAIIRARDMAEAGQRARDSQAAASLAEAQRKRQRDALLDAEVEDTRRASWLAWLTQPGENIERLAANEFSPTWIKDQTPAESYRWPPGDGPDKHTYRNTYDLPALSGVNDDVPPLVLAARKRGAKI